jgi:tetratricopeptide (TPR) repeat protein/predicted aspartyl protease
VDVLKCALMVAALVAATPAFADNKCKLGKVADLPVTMAGDRPMIDAKFADKDARFIVDSGAFYSTLSRASAQEFGLKVSEAAPWFRLEGIGGSTSAGVAVTSDFSLAGIKLPKVDFIVGGSDTGTAGLLGQNILGLVDIEYDLPHGAVRLFKVENCRNVGLAYWAAGKPYSGMPLVVPGNDRIGFKPHTIADVLINGVKVRAAFDTGAPSSILSLAAAKRLGITPESPGVRPIGSTGGIGTRGVATWLATFDRIDIGGEVIPSPKIRIGQIDLGDADMLIGVDFFLTHRVFVSNAMHVMYLTYEGGPLFGLGPKRAVTGDGKAIDLTDKEAEPTTAEGFSRRGAAAASNRKFDAALADFDKAIALAPGEGRYFYQRALARLEAKRRPEGLADLDKAIALAPNDADARLTRAGIRLGDKEDGSALEDVKAADALLAASSDKRLAVAAMYDRLDMPDQALPNYDKWLKSHPEDHSRASAFNGRCWARAQLNQDLDKALSDCNEALGREPHNPAFLDSRGLVRLRQGQLKQALADYDAVLTIEPLNAWSLYCRAIVEAKLGQADKAQTDRETALKITSRVAQRAKKIGLE